MVIIAPNGRHGICRSCRKVKLIRISTRKCRKCEIDEDVTDVLAQTFKDALEKELSYLGDNNGNGSD